MAKAIHSLIRVIDEQCSADSHRIAFGLDTAERLDFDDFAPVCRRNAELANIELAIRQADRMNFVMETGDL